MKNVFIFLLTIYTCSLFGQSNIQISGSIVDSDGGDIDLALVSLLNQKDSSYVKSEYTDKDGSFQLLNVPSDSYIIQVNLLGYKQYSNLINIDGDETHIKIPPITLEADAKLLDEVTITAKVPFVERKIDRTVINPDALISNAGSSALEVLEQAPGVSINYDGSIMLRQREGVVVFINDKPSNLDGTELENYLRALPAGSIKQIEIMENPPAKYEAAGNAGVINIIIKRNTLKGIHGNTSISYRKSKRSGSNNSLNLNYNKNKVSLLLNLDAGFNNSFNDLTINRYYKDENEKRESSFYQNSLYENRRKYVNGKIGMDYYISDATAIGMSYKNVSQPSEREVDDNANVSDSEDALLQRVKADNSTTSTFNNMLVNFYINHELDSLGSKLSFDADYVKYNLNNDQIFMNFIFENDGILTYEDRIDGVSPTTIEIYAAKTDFAKPFSDGSTFEAGLKTARTQTDNEVVYTNTIDGVTTPNYTLSNRFLYDERINSGYVNYNRSIGPIKIQAGLRLESTKINGDQLGNIEIQDSSFTRLYTSLFPTFYASSKMGSSEAHTISFSYGRRIDRPYFQQLNPFVRPFNQFTFYGGNPNLLPIFSHNLSLSYSYNGSINTSLHYSKTIDDIRETLEIRDQIYYSRPGNIASGANYAFSVDINKEMNSWYSFNSYMEVGYQTFESELYTEQLDASGFYSWLQANNTFRLGKGWNAQIGGTYASDYLSGQLFLKSWGAINLGFQKKVLNDKGNLKLSIADLFYTRRGKGVINNLRSTDADWNNMRDTRNVTITFSLRFGKSLSKKQKYNSSGSDSEQNRVRG